MFAETKLISIPQLFFYYGYKSSVTVVMSRLHKVVINRTTLKEQNICRKAGHLNVLQSNFFEFKLSDHHVQTGKGGQSAVATLLIF